MSRTYRTPGRTKGKSHRTRWWFTQDAIQHMTGKLPPEPHCEPRGLNHYKMVEERVTQTEKDRIWVTKGTPFAKPEMHHVTKSYLTYDGQLRSYQYWCETGWYFVMPPVKTKLVKRFSHSTPNPDYDVRQYELQSIHWDRTWAREFRRKGRRKSRYECFMRHYETRCERRKSKLELSQYDPADYVPDEEEISYIDWVAYYEEEDAYDRMFRCDEYNPIDSEPDFDPMYDHDYWDIDDSDWGIWHID